jgi:CcmD family protein
MIKFLYAAYAVTWIIHLSYLAILGRGYKRVKAELRDLARK